MPRIELIPPGWDDSPDRQRGDGAPCIDVCRSCSTTFGDGDMIPPTDDDLSDKYPEHTVGSTEVAHPDYDDEDYKCEICGVKLFAEDN